MVSRTTASIRQRSPITSPASTALPLGGRSAPPDLPTPAGKADVARLDLNHLLIRNPPATYLYRAHGTSMRNAGICDGDILIIDRSILPRDGDIVIAIWGNNQPTCKILRLKQEHIELHSCNPDCAPIHLSPDTEAEFFAVTAVVRTLTRKGRRS